MLMANTVNTDYKTVAVIRYLMSEATRGRFLSYEIQAQITIDFPLCVVLLEQRVPGIFDRL